MTTTSRAIIDKWVTHAVMCSKRVNTLTGKESEHRRAEVIVEIVNPPTLKPSGPGFVLQLVNVLNPRRRGEEGSCERFPLIRGQSLGFDLSRSISSYEHGRGTNGNLRLCFLTEINRKKIVLQFFGFATKRLWQTSLKTTIV